MPRRPDVPCARCGSLMWRGTSSLPPGQSVCRPCRQAAPVPYSRRPRIKPIPLVRDGRYPMRSCAYCSVEFEATSARPQKRCPTCRHRGIKPSSSPCVSCGTRVAFSRGGVSRCHPCRRRRNAEVVDQIAADPSLAKYVRLPSAARGYGYEHQKMRKQFISAFRPGDPCVRCGDPMLDPKELHLDHTDDRSGYLGLSHASCNTRAGAMKRNYGASRPSGQRRRLVDRVCDGCGLSFHPKSRTQWNCSRACVSARRKAA
jgi:hypothetical protein